MKTTGMRDFTITQKRSQEDCPAGSAQAQAISTGGNKPPRPREIYPYHARLRAIMKSRQMNRILIRNTL